MNGNPRATIVVAALAERVGPTGRPALFLARRAAAGRHGGLWELPGGKVEPGEAPAEALLRELEEELGLRARIVGESCGYDLEVEGRPFSFVVFPVDLGGDPIALNAHDEWDYVEASRLAEYRLAPLDGPALEAWARGSGKA